ncbi:MAG TPA: ThuA domain-containing protein [Pirellulaceae bacterium]|nr:ThuA domain-containing protein [Pirellulaceae bacterium]
MLRSLLCIVLLLTCTLTSAAEPKKKRLLLLGQGSDGHPATTHEYLAGLKILERTLAPASEQVEIKLLRADGKWPEGPDEIRQADGVVLYLAEGAKWVQSEPRRFEAFTQLAQRGGGLMALHWATGTKEARDVAGFQQLLGGCHGGADRKYKFLETEVTVADKKHPITQGIDDFTIKDEFYYRLKFIEPQRGLTLLLNAKIDGEAYPFCWAWERPDGGRSFGFTALHYHENWRRVEYRRLIGQAALWTLKLTPPEKNWPGEVREAEYELK